MSKGALILNFIVSPGQLQLRVGVGELGPRGEERVQVASKVLIAECAWQCLLMSARDLSGRYINRITERV